VTHPQPKPTNQPPTDSQPPPPPQVGSQFKRQLAELAAKLSELQPHYVRCIKPNPRNATMLLDRAYTLEQLKWVVECLVHP
jgi:myosin heavy subunit